MSTIVTVIHILVCVILIVAVLLQSGKAGDLAGAFGGVGSQSVFGPRGAATLLSKVTTISAVLFMLTSMGLWILSAKGTRSAVRREKAPAAETETTTTTPAKKTEGEKTKPPAEAKKESQKKKKTPQPETEKKI
ncbi:MAG: preprotein translocase subunit SecG [Candidatus Aminicenantes bacterium]|jgi:preprotein translocase subunit SecG